jgi:hypothetical protein
MRPGFPNWSFAALMVPAPHRLKWSLPRIAAPLANCSAVCAPSPRLSLANRPAWPKSAFATLHQGK